MDPISCVYDANVLYPAQLRDLLMWLALEELTRAHWTGRIHREWTESLLENRPDITKAQLDRTRALMEQALPAASVSESYRQHVEGLRLPDPDDRHVLAAAIEAGANAVVTFNLQDFPPERLRPHGIRALHPDALIDKLAQKRPEDVLAAMRNHRRTQRKPPISPEEYTGVLQSARLEEAARFAARRRDEL